MSLQGKQISVFIQVHLPLETLPETSHQLWCHHFQVGSHFRVALIGYIEFTISKPGRLEDDSSMESSFYNYVPSFSRSSGCKHAPFLQVRRALAASSREETSSSPEVLLPVEEGASASRVNRWCTVVNSVCASFLETVASGWASVVICDECATEWCAVSETVCVKQWYYNLISSVLR